MIFEYVQIAPVLQGAEESIQYSVLPPSFALSQPCEGVRRRARE